MRFGLIGTNFITEWLLAGAAHIEDFEATAVGSRSMDKAKAFASEIGVDAAHGSYEALVADPETETRRLLDFCGLPFNQACLDFHQTARTVQSLPSAAQVRQPIRRDTARSTLYGARLDRLRQRLHDAGASA